MQVKQKGRVGGWITRAAINGVSQRAGPSIGQQTSGPFMQVVLLKKTSFWPQSPYKRVRLVRNSISLCCVHCMTATGLTQMEEMAIKLECFWSTCLKVDKCVYCNFKCELEFIPVTEFKQEYQYNRWVPWSEHTTCSLTEARMLFAVFSASILRPVEPSRMANRSPSSVTGLCSGAGIPPVWTHTITAIIPPGKKNGPFLTPEWAMSIGIHVPPSPAKHKHTPPRAIWPSRTRLSVF